MKRKGVVNQQGKRSRPLRSLKWRGLQARMTISYVLVTAAAVFFLEFLIAGFLGFIISWAYENTLFPQIVGQVARQYALAATLDANGTTLNPASTFRPGQPDSLQPLPDESNLLLPPGGAAMLPYTSALLPDTQPVEFGVLITPENVVLASSYPPQYPNQVSISTLLPNQMAAITNALTHGTATGKTETTPAGLASWVVVPVWGKDRHPIGALYLQEPVVGPDGQLTGHPPDIGKLVVLGVLGGLAMLLVTAPIGGLFGVVTTRGLVRRIRRLVTATTEFAAGHYEQRVPITRSDEIGQLEQHFNQMAEQLVESLNARQELAGQNARLAERARISRELHDAISQNLFSLRMLVGGIQRRLPADSPIAPQIETVQQMSSAMIREMRALLLELRPTQLEHLGLAEALEDVATAYRTRLGIQVTTAIQKVSLPAPVEQALLRITQEALSNAARHADASAITLNLAPQQEQITLTISDNGQGFEQKADANSHGVGLRSMRERVQELGGTLLIESTPGQGTRIQVSLPYKPVQNSSKGATS
jgi:NarL family two-component system sensor histidine kinase LiaS